MKLSDRLKQWRADRPDEWKMDEFIRMAEHMESVSYTHNYNDYGTMKRCTIEVLKPDENGFVVIGDAFDCYRLELLVDLVEI